MTYGRSCVRLDDSLVLLVIAPGDGKKACQYRVLDPCEPGVMGINDLPLPSEPTRMVIPLPARQVKVHAGLMDWDEEGSR